MKLLFRRSKAGLRLLIKRVDSLEWTRAWEMRLSWSIGEEEVQQYTVNSQLAIFLLFLLRFFCFLLFSSSFVSISCLCMVRKYNWNSRACLFNKVPIDSSHTQLREREREKNKNTWLLLIRIIKSSISTENIIYPWLLDETLKFGFYRFLSLTCLGFIFTYYYYYFSFNKFPLKISRIKSKSIKFMFYLLNFLIFFPST